ncbi:MAG: glycosyltransferase family 2 protein [Chloroflexi bacterium]|nr:glycosyltransferase family 2 protein [Chloroflexota bacterium]
MSSPPIQVSVVIPAYNEEKRIQTTLEAITSYLEKKAYSTEVMVVDDGSRDDTAGLVARFAQQHPNIRLLSNPHRGKGYAVKTGMLAARGEFVLQCDADLPVPVEEIDRFVALLKEGYPVVIASREVAGARRIHEPFYRHILGRAFNLLVQLLVIPGVQDTQSGFKAFSREVAYSIFSQVTINGFAYDVEVLFLARNRGFTVVQIPVPYWHHAESKVNPIRDSLSMLARVVGLWWRYRGQRTEPGSGAPSQVLKYNVSSRQVTEQEAAMGMSPKFRQQLEDLLQKMDSPRRRKGAPFTGIPWGLQRLRPSSPGQLMLASFALAVVSLLVKVLLPTLFQWVLVLAALLFALAYITSFMKPGGSYTTRWRGRIIQMPISGEAWWHRLYFWLYGRE